MPSRYNPFSPFGFSLTDDDQDQLGQTPSTALGQTPTSTPQDDSLSRLANSFQPGPVNMHLPPLETIGPVGERAKVVYGETAGFRPQLVDPNGSPDDPNNWNNDSAQKLHGTRVDIATMFGTGANTRMQSAYPRDMSNPIEKREWDNAMKAAMESFTKELPGYTNFYQRQVDAPVQPRKIPSWASERPMSDDDRHGPFYNVGGVSNEGIQSGRGIAKGPNAYIDWYKITR